MKNMTKEHGPNAIGVDVGRVLVGGDGPDTSFLGVPLAEAMNARPIDGAIEALAVLFEHTAGHLYLVSKCGPSVEKKTLAWLDHHRVYARTGLLPSRVHFCRERPEKARIAARLGLRAFVDDRLDVLLPMRPLGMKLVHFGASDTDARTEGILAAPDWRRALTLLLDEGPTTGR